MMQQQSQVCSVNILNQVSVCVCVCKGTNQDSVSGDLALSVCGGGTVILSYVTESHTHVYVSITLPTHM